MSKNIRLTKTEQVTKKESMLIDFCVRPPCRINQCAKGRISAQADDYNDLPEEDSAFVS